MTMDEIIRRLEKAEKKIAALEETLETIKQMNISEQMQEYIESRQRTVQLTGLLNSLSGQGKVDTSEAERQISQAQAQKRVVDKQITDALAAATYVDIDNATPAELFTYEKCTAGAYGGVRITGYNGFDEAIVVIPKHILGKAVISIGEKVFFNGTMDEVILPSSIVEICASAFENCKKLKRINMPSRLICIGKSAFASCYELESIKLPEGIKQIENGAFYNTGISSINFPSSLKLIPDSCCMSCVNLRSLSISEGIERIGRSAFDFGFYGSINQIEYVVIPRSVKEIGVEAFRRRRNMHIAFLGVSTTACHSLTEKESVVLYVIPGSAMQRYARENNYTMKPLTEFPMK